MTRNYFGAMLGVILLLSLLGCSPNAAPGPETPIVPSATAPSAATPLPTATEAIEESQPSGSTLVVAIAAEPSTLNPGISTGFDVHVVADSMFNGLVGLDANANPVPDLATMWEIEEGGRVYTFTLAEGVQWHDGTPFSSADVKFTFEEVLLKYHSRTKAGLENVLEAIETPNERTVVFRFNEPYAPLLQRLDVTEAPILPRHIYEGTDPQTAEANLHPIGTGPFKFASQIPGEEVRLVRNEHYFKEGLPRMAELVFRIIPDEVTQLAALEQGEVDFVWRVPGPDIARLEADPEVVLEQVSSGPGGGFCIMTMSFNLERPIFEDLRVRQAIAHAIDRERLLEQVQFGQGRVAYSPISSRIEWAHARPDLDYEYDPERANTLLDEAGYPRDGSGNRFTIDIVHFPSFNSWGEAMREDLAKVGITLNIRPLERNAAVETIFNNRDFDTNLISYCNNSDPEIGVRRVYVSDNIGPIPFSNGATYRNPQVDALFDEASSTADREERARAYEEIQRILKADLPYWWLVETDGTTAYRAGCIDFQAWSGHFAERAYCEMP